MSLECFSSGLEWQETPRSLPSLSSPWDSCRALLVKCKWAGLWGWKQSPTSEHHSLGMRQGRDSHSGTGLEPALLTAQVGVGKGTKVRGQTAWERLELSPFPAQPSNSLQAFKKSSAAKFAFAFGRISERETETFLPASRQGRAMTFKENLTQQHFPVSGTAGCRMLNHPPCQRQQPRPGDCSGTQLSFAGCCQETATPLRPFSLHHVQVPLQKQISSGTSSYMSPSWREQDANQACSRFFTTSPCKTAKGIK